MLPHSYPQLSQQQQQQQQKTTTAPTATFYTNKEARDATKTLDDQVQSLGVATTRYAKDQRPSVKDLESEIKKTEKALQDNPKASPEVRTQATNAINHANATLKQPNSEDKLASAKKTSDAATNSTAATQKALNRSTRGTSDVYGTSFQRRFGDFAMINQLATSVNAVITAEGNMQSKLADAQSTRDQAASTTYGSVVQSDQANAQLVETILSQLQQASTSMAQSQEQDVSFVKGA